MKPRMQTSNSQNTLLLLMHGPDHKPGPYAYELHYPPCGLV